MPRLAQDGKLPGFVQILIPVISDFPFPRETLLSRIPVS